MRALCVALLAFACAANAGSDARLRSHYFAETRKAISLDGTNDYFTRSADLTGSVDGQQGTISVWFLWTSLTGRKAILSNRGTDGSGTAIAGVLLRTGNGGAAPQMLLGTAAGTSILVSTSTATITTGAWHHLISSWDLSVPTAAMWIDGVDVTNNTTLTNATADYTRTTWRIGSTFTAEKFPGCLYGLWFNLTYLDLSVLANRRLFRTDDGHPSYLGTSGQIPTGNTPLIASRAGGGGDNRAKGGAFTAVGAPSLCGSAP